MSIEKAFSTAPDVSQLPPAPQQIAEEDRADVVVYSKPACVQCNATYRALDRQGISYESVDLTKDKAALRHVKELGYSQAPVVVAGEDSWSGFRPDKISNLEARTVDRAVGSSALANTVELQ